MHDSATPLMRQYFQIKQQHPDTLMLFQVGDFYELFFDDAKQASAFLGIALTKRGTHNGEPIPLCGVPVHALDHYITKLIRGGFKVALCDQLEEAKPGKVVDRGVTRVFTPGTLTESNLLDAKSASYVFSFFPLHDAWGLLFGELLTAQLFATVIPSSSERIIEAETARFFPDEVLLPATATGKQYQSYFKQLGYFTSLVTFDESDAQQQQAVSMWLQQFKADVRSSLDTHAAVRMALYHFYTYIQATHVSSLSQFNHLHFYEPDDFLQLDASTMRNLELVKNNHDGGRAGTLLATMDQAVTGMGSRTIKKWLLRPLVSQEVIVQRQEVVGRFVADHMLVHQVRHHLGAIGDLERVIGRIALRRASVQDYIMLQQALGILPQLRSVVQHAADAPLVVTLLAALQDFTVVHDLLVRALHDDSSKEWIIKAGFDARLDAVRDLVATGNHKILELEQREQQATGISSLKIRYNQAHGYSIEITKTHYDAVPDYYIRRQTLVGRERYTTQELQQLEHAIAQARVEINEVEKELFEALKHTVAQYTTPLRKAAYALAHVDALVAFATIAYDYNYVQPQLVNHQDIIIQAGRHPVIERALANRFITNDTVLTHEQALWIITGPNMGGKSTFLRQTALISLMAHCGSFVPAKHAQIPIMDRIFTRIGGGDNLVGGKSTFMVEMEETAAICTQATSSSLVILDEVGRGTSTFDGLAIAQAVVEHLYTNIKARCLFATHYHELTHLEREYPGIVSYYASSSKTPQGIVFLYKMVRGIADGSFGVEVAKLAHLPPAVIGRAEAILNDLNQGSSLQLLPATKIEDAALAGRLQAAELALAEKDRALEVLKAIDYDNLSPKQAFDLLWGLRLTLLR